MRDDYRFAESSYKAAVSFFLGMIGVRVVFEKLMGGGVSLEGSCFMREIVSNLY